MTLEPLTREDAEQVRVWRNRSEMQAVLRTAKRLTYEEQQDWYTREIANRESHTRYWALYDDHLFCGYGGIEHISWENSNGEISLLIDPERHGEGLGSAAVGLFLDQAFDYLNLNTVYGECYCCGPVGFWKKQIKRHNGSYTILPRRKYYGGNYHDSYYFTFIRKGSPL